MFRKPVIYGIYFVLFWSSVSYFFTKDLRILPHAFNLLDDGLILILAAVSLPWGVKYRFKELWPAIIFILVGIFSMVANQVPLFQAIYGLRFVTLGALLYFVIINVKLRETSLKSIVKLIFFVAGIHCIAIVIEFIFYVSKGAYTSPDLITGLSGPGSANSLGYLIIILLITSLIDLFQRKKNKIVNIFKIISITLLIIVIGSRSIIFVFPLTFVLLYRDYGKKLTRVLKYMVPVAIVLIFVSSYFYGKVGRYKFSEEYNPVALYYGQTKPGRSAARILHIPYAWNMLKNYSCNILLGTGPGTYESDAGWLFNAPLPRKKERDITAFKISGQATPITHMQFVTIMVEFGLLGLFFSLFILPAIFLRVSRAGKDFNEDYYWNKVVILSKTMVLLLLFGTIVGNLWEVQYVVFPVWALSAIVVKKSLIMKKSHSAIKRSATNSKYSSQG